MERLPKDKTWRNAVFLSALKNGVAAGDFVKNKQSYKLSPEFKKKLVAKEKKAAAPAKPAKKTATKKTSTKKKAVSYLGALEYAGSSFIPCKALTNICAYTHTLSLPLTYLFQPAKKASATKKKSTTKASKPKKAVAKASTKKSTTAKKKTTAPKKAKKAAPKAKKSTKKAKK